MSAFHYDKVIDCKNLILPLENRIINVGNTPQATPGTSASKLYIPSFNHFLSNRFFGILKNIPTTGLYTI